MALAHPGAPVCGPTPGVRLGSPWPDERRHGRFRHNERSQRRVAGAVQGRPLRRRSRRCAYAHVPVQFPRHPVLGSRVRATGIPHIRAVGHAVRRPSTANAVRRPARGLVRRGPGSGDGFRVETTSPAGALPSPHHMSTPATLFDAGSREARREEHRARRRVATQRRRFGGELAPRTGPTRSGQHEGRAAVYAARPPLGS